MHMRLVSYMANMSACMSELDRRVQKLSEWKWLVEEEEALLRERRRQAAEAADLLGIIASLTGDMDAYETVLTCASTLDPVTVGWPTVDRPMVREHIFEVNHQFFLACGFFKCMIRIQSKPSFSPGITDSTRSSVRAKALRSAKLLTDSRREIFEVRAKVYRLRWGMDYICKTLSKNTCQSHSLSKNSRQSHLLSKNSHQPHASKDVAAGPGIESTRPSTHANTLDSKGEKNDRNEISGEQGGGFEAELRDVDWLRRAKRVTNIDIFYAMWGVFLLCAFGVRSFALRTNPSWRDEISNEDILGGMSRYTDEGCYKGARRYIQVEACWVVFKQIAQAFFLVLLLHVGFLMGAGMVLLAVFIFFPPL